MRTSKMLLPPHLAILSCTGLLLVTTTMWAGNSFPIYNKSRRSVVVEVVQQVQAAVVNIQSERTVAANGEDSPLGPPVGGQRVNGMGTGIIIDPRGYIVTNHHVVEDVTVLRVKLVDGTTHAARVVSRDPETDLAILKIDVGKPLPIMPLGTSSDLMVGEPVIAIGNAFGYEHSVTTGVISFLNRDVTLNKDLSYKALIQTDAAINPGNSGGPLLNIHGELIGVNVAIRSGAQGIAFAIPVDAMIRTVSEMMARRRTTLYHGLEVSDVVESGDGPVKRSLVIKRCVRGGPGVEANLQPNDILLKANDTLVRCSLDLERVMIDRQPGDKIALLVQREGKEISVDLTIQGLDRPALGGNDLVWQKLGLRLQATQNDQVARINTQLHGGLVVTDVNPGTPASKAGMQRGDILIGLHQWETITLENVSFVVSHPDLATFSPVRFFIIRGGQIRRGWLTNLE